MPLQDQFALEQCILRALASHPTGEEYSGHLSSLNAYGWQEAEHQILYEALRRIGFLEPSARRRELPAEITRMGFPDVNAADCFEGESVALDKLPALIRQLQTFDKLPT